MKKKYLKILLGIFLFIFAIGYSYYFRPIVDDELFNYGFSYNITKGLIPYRDFNMIITPLFTYLLAGVIKIFGAKLIVYHIVIAFIILGIFCLSYKNIGKKAFIIYFMLLIYPYTGYNMFCLGLIFVLFNVLDNPKCDIIEPIIISMMILTKQTLGLLVIPSLIFSRNKKKTFLIYLIFFLIFLIYLIGFGNMMEFLDYCLFGMFDFANKNTTNSFNFLVIVEIIIIGVLGYLSFKTKRKDIFYCLMFQVITLPIIDYIHFVISFIPVIYLLLKQYKDNSYVFLFGITIIVSFFFALNTMILLQDKNYLYLDHYEVNNFMKGRVTYRITQSYVFKAYEYVNKYSDYRPYILGHFSYLIKLNHDLPINKYDIINNGNMGYKGGEKYLNEIDDYCSSNKCMFIINDSEATISKTIQTNREILKYVKKNYTQRYCSNTFSVYTN